MKTRPMLMSAPMVRALLNGTKTQTRRVVKSQPRERDDISPDRGALAWQTSPGHFIASTLPTAPKLFIESCPYGQPGDRLYVRETWAQPTTFDPGPTFYRADYPDCVPREFKNVPPASEITWKPSIHMPRSLSRITLEIVGVSVERLQDISEADAKAEGVENPFGGWVGGYQKLWESINGPGSWSANPWVWIVEFKRVQP